MSSDMRKVLQIVESAEKGRIDELFGILGKKKSPFPPRVVERIRRNRDSSISIMVKREGEYKLNQKMDTTKHSNEMHQVWVIVTPDGKTLNRSFPDTAEALKFIKSGQPI